MSNPDLIIIKLGGSVITNKEKPLSPNYPVIEKIAQEIKKIGKNYKVIVVHGGGSFGHYWSVKYDMHTNPRPYPDEGISLVHESMIKLNYIIIEKMISFGMKPFTIPPSSFVFNNSPCIERIEDMLTLSRENNLIPVTYGDVVHTNKGNFSILSGDSIMSMLSLKLLPKFSIFTTNVDGLYEDIQEKKIIKEVIVDDKNSTISNITKNIESSRIEFDVTGGMKRKINESFNIVKSGIPVYLINGLFPERMDDVIKNRDFVGTCIKQSQLIK